MSSDKNAPHKEQSQTDKKAEFSKVPFPGTAYQYFSKGFGKAAMLNKLR